MKKRLVGPVLIPLMALSLTAFTQVPLAPADDRPDRELPASISDLKLDSPVSATDVDLTRLDTSLRGVSGDQRVVVRLARPAIAEQNLSDSASAREKAALVKAQRDLMAKVTKLDRGATLLAQTQVVLNAVFVEVDAAALEELAKDPAVERIAPVGNYELDLSETVPYIGATEVQDSGYDGSGIKVAVLDSGIDYTHAALGGSGKVADFDKNDPTIIERRSFPTKKVVGGYDFVGSDWTGEVNKDGEDDPPLKPDPDPLDDGAGGGHGTHVADIIGGMDGVAPGVDLYAVKVCSSVSTSCSGIALIQGMEYSLDPNGDGKLRDRVNIINMSLGSSYGQPFDDDLSAAVENATMAGVLTVASAGNSGDKPYANGTPAASPSALSVAQTAVPSAVLPLMEVTPPEGIPGTYPAVFQPWSAPLTSPIEAPVQYGDGAGGNLLGCNPFEEGSLVGKIVLVDRGTCTFSVKIDNIDNAGGLVGIIGLVTTDDPFEGGFGGGEITIPGYMVSQDVSGILKSELPGTEVRFDPAATIPLIETIVGSSARGPQHEDTTLIKPEIGAPGASISAIAGTGTDTGPFGGTSGAAPMVSGAAALVLDAAGGVKATPNGTPNGLSVGHGLRPIEVKSLLVNNGFTDIINVFTNELTPITRIGGGEVRVNDSVSAPAATWASDVPSGTLSLGFVDVTDTVTFTKTVTIRNYENKKRTYEVTPTFRFEDDELNGAVSVSAPTKVSIKPGKGRDTTFRVTFTIDGAKLRENSMNSGIEGANPAALTLNEYDGYLVLDDGTHPIHLPWHVLPRKAAEVVPDATEIVPGSFPQIIGLENLGVGTAQNDAYALLAVSENLPEGMAGKGMPTPDIRAVGINTFPVPAGFCSANASFLWVFAVNTWEPQQHLLPVSHQIYLDTNQDGTDDYVVLNRDASGLGTITDGRQLAWILNLATGSASAFFFAEHATNTGNTALTICGEQIGMKAADLLATNVDMDVVAQDFYYGGPGDAVEGLTVTPLGERFLGLPNDVPGNTYDPAGLTVFDYDPWPGNTDELGLLLFTNGDRGAGVRGGATQDTEALLFLVK